MREIAVIRPFAAIALAVALAAALAGCATSRRTPCGAGETQTRTARLYVAPSAKGPRPSEAAVRKFLDEEVSPRFPDGLTVLRGGRAWTAHDPWLIRASAQIVQVVVPAGPEGDARLERLRVAYRARFRQEPVIQVAPPACMAF